MNRKSILTVAVWATATFAAGAALTWPGGIRAGEEAQQQAGQALIQRPRLTVGQCDLSLAPRDVPDGKRGYELTVVNHGDSPATVTCTVSLQVTPPSSPLARMVPAPRKVWQKEVAVHLQPHATQRVQMAVDVELPPGTATELLTSGDKSIIAIRHEAAPVRRLAARGARAD